MFSKKLHWYMLTFLKVIDGGTSWGVANSYVGNIKPRVTKNDIERAKEFTHTELSEDNVELTLQGISYMGKMSNKEFEES